MTGAVTGPGQVVFVPRRGARAAVPQRLTTSTMLAQDYRAARRLYFAALVLAIGLSAAVPSHAEGGDADYGAYLAAQCTACHQSASATRVPQIAGLTEAYLLDALRAYRSGRRANTTMANVVAAYGEAEIEALAAYFAQQ